MQLTVTLEVKVKQRMAREKKSTRSVALIRENYIYLRRYSQPRSLDELFDVNDCSRQLTVDWEADSRQTTRTSGTDGILYL